ncbi:dynamin family protein [Mechercharimyces sp. CAU 1602]|uniref:dynamin family protein n=1 Tax=Mechercharimyces sp. CAU 1602 TaxID=2973933 RepID=UPI002161AD02|nr:dynamin family protein [Mechercharimyces sp. CAU 1602]MCS1351321.1 dynamin family protein [Mechercharimyces sp. CAU 1602]
MIEIEQEALLERISYFYEQMKARGDHEYAHKMLDLLRKVHRQELMIGFCGHFSAGKSTLLNHVLGEELLPTSPIPTSANVVRIQKGPAQVILHTRQGEKQVYRGTYTDKQLKQLCKNGDEVIAIDVMQEANRLPEGVVLLDTPGIDSTDDRHQSATEAALHLADIVFYVVDYNHVQSETNLQFLKNVTQRGKHVYLVVNQIDKHQESELSFVRFQEGLTQSLTRWELNLKGILYTSLRNPDHIHNEWDQLLVLLDQCMEERLMMLTQQAKREVAYLLEQHVEGRRKHEREEQRQELAKRTRPLLELAPLNENVQELRESLAEHIAERANIEVRFNQGLDDLLQNTYLMPYDVRELAHQYLETMLTDFKVGFIRRRSKTEAERQKRLFTFYEKWMQTVETQVDFHVKRYVLQFFEENGIYREADREVILQWEHTLSASDVGERVKEGASLSGSYLLKYTDDLVNMVKRLYRQQAGQWFNQFQTELMQRLDSQIAEMKTKLKKLEEDLILRQKWVNRAEEEEAYRSQLEAIFKGTKEVGYMPDIDHYVTKEEGEVVLSSILSEEFMPTQVKKEIPQLVEGRQGVDQSDEDRLSHRLRRIKQIEKVMTGISSVERIRSSLSQMRARAENQQWTVALFGAFSAGKSSFANALIGEDVLPVSPHPTTATINRIVAPTAEFPHQHVRIRLKSEEQLQAEIERIWHLIFPDSQPQGELVDMLRVLTAEREGKSSNEKLLLPFLQALYRGYPTMKARLGDWESAHVRTFSPYVAEEETACFVQEVEVYFDCELTRQGIMLVDTPGADSVHARHTDVAFRYLKEADALLFVMYYNHAFSRADREFLLQLGRVKDTFAMDKMFFLMNAADLATSTEEQDAVLMYLQEQLQEYGIRFPRLFPISSLYARSHLEKERAASGMEAFVRAFRSFFRDDLMQVAITSMKEEARRAEQIVRQQAATAHSLTEERDEKMEQLVSERAKIEAYLNNYRAEAEEHALKQEIEELFYYVEQRVMLRYRDAFTEIFHPSTLRKGESNSKKVLYRCTMDLIDFIRRDVVQELQATSLRLEKWLREQCVIHGERMMLGSVALTKEWRPPQQIRTEWTFAEWEIASPLMNLTPTSFKKALGLFKNSKHFFEQGGKMVMMEQMAVQWKLVLATVIREEQSRCYSHYEQQWRQAVQVMKEEQWENTDHFYASVEESLSGYIDAHQYEECADEIASLLSSMS